MKRQRSDLERDNQPLVDELTALGATQRAQPPADDLVAGVRRLWEARAQAQKTRRLFSWPRWAPVLAAATVLLVILAWRARVHPPATPRSPFGAALGVPTAQEMWETLEADDPGALVDDLDRAALERVAAALRKGA
jgi:hypothetical protein